MKEISLILLISIFLLLCSTTTSFIIVKFIQLIHILLCLFVILGPFFIKDKELLIFYVMIVSFIIFHWIVSSDVCALTLFEQWVTGKPSDYTFIGRLVKPVYNITNRCVTSITIGLLLIAVIRLMKIYKLF